MLKKVLSVTGLGLLHDSGVSPAFAQCTLLFAENGRGKSTFTTLLESLRSGDITELSRLRTIDQRVAIEARMVFDDGAPTSELSNESWDHTRPNIRVFDSRFVRENVYSGSQIDPAQRRNLLNFVLGDSAVAESTKERTATEHLASTRAAIRTAEASLMPLLNGSTLEEFLAFPADPQITTRIAEVDRKIQNHASAAQIMQMPVPSPVNVPNPHLSETLELLARGLDHIQQSATGLVETHLTEHAGEQFEGWVREGSQFEDGESCPYCGQSVDASELLAAYRQYFSAEYFNHVEKVEALAGAFTQAVGPVALQELSRRIAQEERVARDWAARTDMENIDFDVEQCQQLFGELHAEVFVSIRQKISAPLEAVDSTSLRPRAEEIWTRIDHSLASLNGVISRNLKKVQELRNSLVAADMSALKVARDRLEAQRLRHTTGVDGVVARIIADRAKADRLERDRDVARAKVKELMNKTLSTYQGTINDLLVQFGAGFSVKEMRTNFRGASPQSEYVIVLRSKEVPLKAENGGPYFDTALSEGDKRTLALAFFVACIGKDPNLSHLIVAVDDPMSSMDAGRRHMTIETLLDIQEKCMQLILSSHDAVFLRDYQLHLSRRSRAVPTAVVELRGPLGGYSRWGSPSLDALCESARRKALRELEEFVETGDGDPQLIAGQIRPLLEGYLHSRFPTLLGEGLLIGDSLKAIRTAVAPSPLAFAHNIADEIERINRYAGAFHHDGNPGYVRPVANAQEVQAYALRSLNLIYSGTA